MLIFSVQIAEIPKKIIKIGEFLTRIAENEQDFENKTAKMRKCLTKFSRIVECGAVQKCSPYSHCQRSVPCALSFRYSSRLRCFAAVWWSLLRGRVLSPEDACQKRFSRFSDWRPKLQKCERTRVNLVDLVKSFQTSTRQSVIARYIRVLGCRVLRY